MLNMSPSGALSPYYYKGGYFHGIHYGSYFDDYESLFKMIDKEEAFILKSPDKRRIMMDFYETNLSDNVIEKIVTHITNIDSKIIKLAVATDKRGLSLIKKALRKSNSFRPACCYFCTDMEEGKTWLVSDEF